MSSSLKLQQASELLLAALQLAQAERDRALVRVPCSGVNPLASAPA